MALTLIQHVSRSTGSPAKMKAYLHKLLAISKVVYYPHYSMSRMLPIYTEIIQDFPFSIKCIDPPRCSFLYQSQTCVRNFSSSNKTSEEASEDLMKHLEAEEINKKSKNQRRRLPPSDEMINVGKLVPHRMLDLVDDTGEILRGIMSSKAVSLSQDADLKLVLVNQHAKPLPLYKLMTGHELHEEQMKINEKKKNKSGPTIVKDMKLSATIGSNDINVKRKHLADWLIKDKNVQIRVTVMQKRGQVLSKEDMVAIVHQLIDGVEAPLVFNNEPKMFGKNAQNLGVVLRPMSAKEKAKYNKEKNLMERMKNIDSSTET